MPDDDFSQIMDKYRAELRSQVGGETVPAPIASREYKEFKKEYLEAKMNWYEKGCNLSEKLIQIPYTDKKKEAEVRGYIETCHLNVTPTGANTFSFLGPIAFVAAGIFLSSLIPVLFGATPNLFFIMFFLFVGVVLIFTLAGLPEYYAQNWRLKSSNQMVLCVFYVVTYMRHSSNLELAIDFAAEHLGPPMSLDMKKIIWDVETQKYESVKESLEHYLETWKKTNPEFVEAFNLIVSSLYESSEDRRLYALDKSLNVILDETYEKMLHYAQNLKQPITMLHMLGIMMPILTLVILPLAVSFLQDTQTGLPMIKWYHLLVLYDVILPIGIFYMGKNILATRPTGYGDTDISESNPELEKYKNVLVNIGGVQLKIPPLWIALFIGFGLLFIGSIPLLFHGLGIGDTFMGLTIAEYKCPFKVPDCAPDQMIGPFGIGAAILSLFVTLALGLSVGVYYKLKSQNVIKIREETKKLEDEFASALFQLGNRLGDNLPLEIAIEKVADVTQGTNSGEFFRTVSTNIRRLGMGVHQAIFDPKVGALSQYPSSLIASSMKVLTESAKKGPLVASQAIISVSEYVKQIHRVNERLKDLMADIISSMKSQVNFMTPVIAGIVVGITSMITLIMGKIMEQIMKVKQNSATTGGSGGIPDIFGMGMPTYYFQIVVGLYVVEIIFILTILVNGIENGSDVLSERYALGNNMVRSTLLYCGLAFAVMMVFNFIGGTILSSGIAGGMG